MIPFPRSMHISVHIGQQCGRRTIFDLGVYLFQFNSSNFEVIYCVSESNRIDAWQWHSVFVPQNDFVYRTTVVPWEYRIVVTKLHRKMFSSAEKKILLVTFGCEKYISDAPAAFDSVSGWGGREGRGACTFCAFTPDCVPAKIKCFRYNFNFAVHVAAFLSTKEFTANTQQTCTSFSDCCIQWSITILRAFCVCIPQNLKYTIYCVLYTPSMNTKRYQFDE